MTRLVDFHIHIDYYENYREIYDYLIQNKIYALFVTNLPEIFERCRREFPESKYVKIGLGYNPQLAKTHRFNKLLFDRLLPHTKYIGEVGLDYSEEILETKTEQQRVFQYICKRAGETNKILSIHSRRAEKDTLDILIENKVRFAVFHWYSGTKMILDEIIANGYYLSVNYSMLNTMKGLNIIKAIPMDRLLIETDAPFGKSSISGKSYNLSGIYKEFEKKLKVEKFDLIVFNNLRKLLVDQNNC